MGAHHGVKHGTFISLSRGHLREVGAWEWNGYKCVPITDRIHIIAYPQIFYSEPAWSRSAHSLCPRTRLIRFPDLRKLLLSSTMPYLIITFFFDQLFHDEAFSGAKTRHVSFYYERGNFDLCVGVCAPVLSYLLIIGFFLKDWTGKYMRSQSLRFTAGSTYAVTRDQETFWILECRC